MSAPLTLVQALGVPRRGLLVFLPVYRPGLPVGTPEERRLAAIGWTYVPLVIDEVLDGLDMEDGTFDIALSDRGTNADQPFFATAPVRADSAEPSRQLTLPLFGRTWQVGVQARPKFRRNLNLPSPPAIGALVFVASVILAAFIALRAFGRQRRRLAAVERSRLAAIVEGSNDAIIGRDLRGVVTDWNAAAERIFGFTASEAVGRRIADLILPPDLQAEEDEILDKVRGGILVPHVRTSRLRSDGALLPMLVSVSPIRAPDGTVIGAAITARDISDQLAAEEHIRALNASLEGQVAERTAQLEASSALQAAILNYAGYAVIATDPAGIITLFNPAAERMLGHRAADLLGVATPALFHLPDEMVARARSLSAEFAETIEPGFGVIVARTQRGLPNAEEWTYVTSSGDRLPILLNVSPLRAPDGTELGFLGIAIDLTDQNRRAAELEAARRSAEQAARSKSEFLATMSHELRTPLNSIIGFSGLMLDGVEPTTPTLERHARIIHDASRTLLSIVNDVLDVSKIEAGQLDLDPRPFSLSHLVEGTVELLRNQAAEKGLPLRVALPAMADGAMLVGDDVRIRQILINLLSNAIKFTAQGTIVVAVEDDRCDEGRASLRFSVTDTGIGIPAAKRHRIFRPFSQADSSTSRRFGGTGLGLSICRSLVGFMGGAIGFESEEGRGSTFWFAFDLPVSPPDAPDLTAPGPALPRSNIPPLHILLAEDVAMNQELAIALLSRWGHAVDVVSDGASAVDAIQRAPYDLVLMDIQMPVMDGIEATQRIRALGERYARVPIVAMTANVMADDIAHFRSVGMDDHLGKPFVARQLKAILETWGSRELQDGIPTVPRSEAPTAEGADILDRAMLADMSDLLGPQRLAELIRAFIPDLQRRLASIAEGGTPVLMREAHALASSAGQLGFAELSLLCQRIEREAERQDATKSAAMLDASAQRAVAAARSVLGVEAA